MLVDDRHARAVGQAFRRMASLCGGASVDDEGLLLYRTATPQPIVWNGALVVTESLPAAEVVRRSDEFFAAEGRDYGFWVLGRRDASLVDALAAVGAELVSDDPHMSLDLDGVEPTMTADVELELVTDAGGRERFVQIASRSFEVLGVAPATWELVYPSVAAVTQDDVITVVAVDRGVPLAGAMGYLDGEICELIHVGTDPSARRRGLGAAVTMAVMSHAKHRGATEAILQATHEGEGVYRRIGFRELERYRLYLRSTAQLHGA